MVLCTKLGGQGGGFTRGMWGVPDGAHAHCMSRVQCGAPVFEEHVQLMHGHETCYQPVPGHEKCVQPMPGKGHSMVFLCVEVKSYASSQCLAMILLNDTHGMLRVVAGTFSEHRPRIEVAHNYDANGNNSGRFGSLIFTSPPLALHFLRRRTPCNSCTCIGSSLACCTAGRVGQYVRARRLPSLSTPFARWSCGTMKAACPCR
eukprot:1158589-Pelagomonas_calceolata.AAC.5